MPNDVISVETKLVTPQNIQSKSETDIYEHSKDKILALLTITVSFSNVTLFSAVLTVQEVCPVWQSIFQDLLKLLSDWVHLPP